MDAFEDVRSLGRGAYASVRLCRRRADGELVVVKRFHSSIAELSSKERHEMSQEIKLLSHLHHRNIVAFLGSFVADGVQHIVMEYAAGGTLAKYLALREGELLPEADVLEKFVQVLAALRYCHRAGVLHRDLKPANILLSGLPGPAGAAVGPQAAALKDRVVKLTDFGVSKIIGAGGELAATVIGTPAYVSPEVVQGQGADKKADIWVRGHGCSRAGGGCWCERLGVHGGRASSQPSPLSRPPHIRPAGAGLRAVRDVRPA